MPIKTRSLFEYELTKPNWPKIVEANGPATRIPTALRELFDARSPKQAEAAYWKLENHIVVQGQLYEAASFVVPVLLAALATPDRPDFVRSNMLELLFQIINGFTHSDEVKRGIINI